MFFQSQPQNSTGPTLAQQLASFGVGTGSNGGTGAYTSVQSALPNSNPGWANGPSGQHVPIGNMPANLPNFGAASESGGGLFGDMGFGEKADLALSGLQTIGNLWSAFQSQKLAKKQFNFTKDVTNTNLANQIQSYNTALSDRSNSRAHTEGRSQASADEYTAANSAKRSGG